MERETFTNRVSHAELTRVQMRIADYFVKNQKRVLGMTAQEIGKEIGISDASIIRFSRAIGYEGFTNLKEEIQKELTQNSEKLGKHSLFDRYVLQSERYNNKAASENEILRLMEANLEASIRQNREDLYERIAAKILNSNRKVCIGLRGGKGCTVRFARLLGHITSKVSGLTEESYDEICKLSELDENDVVIFLNFPRYYEIDEKIASIIGKQQVPCYLITDSMASPVTKYASEVLLVETEHCGFFHSMLGVEGVLEYLLILMCYKNPEGFRKRLQERDAILDDYRLDC